MASDGFEPALALVLKHEGGYVDHPLDPGGATNLGITRATLARWRGKPVAKAEVIALSRSEAAQIYRKLYWDRISGDRLPSGVALVVFDAAVNSGPDRAARWLQAVLGVATDGVIGPVTLAAVKAADPARVVRDFSARRLSFLRRLATWSAFGRGWSRRVRETEASALAMIPDARPVPNPARNPRQERPMMTDPQAMTATKSMLASRTLWANAVGLASVLYVAFGGDAATIDAQVLGTQIAEVMAALSFLASSAFRIIATRRLQG